MTIQSANSALYIPGWTRRECRGKWRYRWTPSSSPGWDRSDQLLLSYHPRRSLTAADAAAQAAACTTSRPLDGASIPPRCHRVASARKKNPSPKSKYIYKRDSAPFRLKNVGQRCRENVIVLFAFSFEPAVF